MRVEYGPPGHKGVTQIMGLGASNGHLAKAESLIPQDKSSRTVGLLAAATIVGGMVLGSNTAKNLGFGGLLAVAYIQMLKPKPAKVLVDTPASVQGWG
jgi:hypothetical protein